LAHDITLKPTNKNQGRQFTQAIARTFCQLDAFR